MTKREKLYLKRRKNGKFLGKIFNAVSNYQLAELKLNGYFKRNPRSIDVTNWIEQVEKYKNQLENIINLK